MTQGASMAPAQSVQENVALDELYRSGDYYTLLNLAVSHLGENPTDTGVALIACQAYMAMGLIGPARELLNGPLASLPQVEQLQLQVRRAPSGRASWRAFQGQFEANCARLYERYPDLRRYDEAFRSVPRNLELFRSNDGNLHISTKGEDGVRRWLPDLAPIREIAAQSSLPHDPKALMCGPYVILCDRFNAFLDRVFEATWQMFLTFSPRIYVLEPDVQRLAVTLYAMESIDRLCHDRVNLFVGPDCVDELEEHLCAHPALALPAYVVQGSAPAPPESTVLVNTLRRLTSQRTERTQSVIGRVKGHYDSLPAGYWEKRLAAGNRFRILGVTSRFTTFLKHSMRDWQAAFERLGHEFRLHIEPNDHDVYAPIAKAEIIDEWKPDLVVVIDHLRHEYAETIPRNLPYVCWIQDELNNLTNGEAGRSVGPMDFVCGFSKNAFVRDYGYPPERFLPCVIPTNPGLYDSAPVPDADREQHACDISATTHASKTAEEMCDEYAARLKDPAAGVLLRSIHEELMRRIALGEFLTSTRICRLVCECEEQTGVHAANDQIRMAMFADCASRMHDRSIRHRTLEWVGRWAKRTGRTFALYGNGWDTHPTLGEFARGSIANGYDLRCVYQASTISLHVSGFGSVHQRVLDGLSSGAFFLVRYNPGDFVGEVAVQLAAAIRETGVKTMEELRALEAADVQHCLRLFCEAGFLLPGDVELPIPRVLEYLVNAADTPVNASQHLPRFAEICFDTEEAFVERAEFFLASPDQREAIASRMREAVHRKYTYDGFTESLLTFIRERLTEPQASACADVRVPARRESPRLGR